MCIYIYKQVQQHIHDKTDTGKPERQLKPMSQTYEERKAQLLNSIITSPEGTPTKVITFKPNTLTPVDLHDVTGRKRRSGQPRIKWVDTTMENLWHLIKTTNEIFRCTTLDLKNE